MLYIDKLNKQYDLLHNHYSRMMWLYGDKGRACVQRARQAMRDNMQADIKARQ